jgi:predicted transcriptional regulator
MRVRIPNKMVKDSAPPLLEEQDLLGTEVEEGIAQADRVELVDDDEVRIWLDKKGRSRAQIPELLLAPMPDSSWESRHVHSPTRGGSASRVV